MLKEEKKEELKRQNSTAALIPQVLKPRMSTSHIITKNNMGPSVAGSPKVSISMLPLGTLTENLK